MIARLFLFVVVCLWICVVMVSSGGDSGKAA